MILNEPDLKVIVTVEHRNQEVSDIKFSPGYLFEIYLKKNIFLN